MFKLVMKSDYAQFEQIFESYEDLINKFNKLKDIFDYHAVIVNNKEIKLTKENV